MTFAAPRYPRPADLFILLNDFGLRCEQIAVGRVDEV